MVVTPMFFAVAKAARRFAELPLVEMPIRPSPGLPCAMIWRDEDMIEADIVADGGNHRDVGDEIDAASAGRPAVIGCTNSTAMCAASQLEPPLPIEKSRPPRR